MCDLSGCPTESYTLVWGPTNSHTKLFRFQTPSCRSTKTYQFFKILYPSIPDNIIYLFWWRLHSSAHTTYDTLWNFSSRWCVPPSLFWPGHITRIRICLRGTKRNYQGVLQAKVHRNWPPFRTNRSSNQIIAREMTINCLQIPVIHAFLIPRFNHSNTSPYIFGTVYWIHPACFNFLKFPYKIFSAQEESKVEILLLYLISQLDMLHFIPSGMVGLYSQHG